MECWPCPSVRDTPITGGMRRVAASTRWRYSTPRRRSRLVDVGGLAVESTQPRSTSCGGFPVYSQASINTTGTSRRPCLWPRWLPVRSNPIPSTPVCTRNTTTLSTAGGWRSTSTRATGATHAWRPAMRRTTCRSWAPTPCTGDEPCRGCGSSASWSQAAQGSTTVSSRCCASTAIMHRARPCARPTRRTTTTRASTLRSTTDVLARGTAPTTAPIRCGASTGRTSSFRSRSTFSSTRT